jgi:hypothetical protein
MPIISGAPGRTVAALASALLVSTIWSTAAWACRGGAEYPEVAAKLATASLPSDKKAELARQLEEGRAMHDKAHQQNDTNLMRKSLKILDKVKGAL